MVKGDDSTRDLIAEQYLKLGQSQAHLFKACGMIMSSDAGESFVALVNALTDGFKDQALFSDDENSRLVMRGAVIGLNTLLSQIAEFATRDAEIGEEDVTLKDMVPSYASLGDDDEL